MISVSQDAARGAAPASRQEFSDAMADAMRIMHRDMTAATPTGHVDKDFAAAMIPHHQAGVEMGQGAVAVRTRSGATPACAADDHGPADGD
ncbi:MAG: DUF305 domain-containing protein [Acidobacteria bacterium]|nr:DUF305 domain-containing protein [Acidobacteriota bacterium]